MNEIPKILPLSNIGWFQKKHNTSRSLRRRCDRSNSEDRVPTQSYAVEQVLV